MEPGSAQQRPLSLPQRPVQHGPASAPHSAWSGFPHVPSAHIMRSPSHSTAQLNPPSSIHKGSAKAGAGHCMQLGPQLFPSSKTHNDPHAWYPASTSHTNEQLVPSHVAVPFSTVGHGVQESPHVAGDPLKAHCDPHWWKFPVHPASPGPASTRPASTGPASRGPASAAVSPASSPASDDVVGLMQAEKRASTTARDGNRSPERREAGMRPAQ